MLILVILLAAALRFVSLNLIPVGFNDDEAAFGYNAFSIIKTGRDEWGRFLPFPVFESFGDWKLVGYLYLAVVSQLIFGISEFATRFPSALFGIFAVFTTYLLAKKLFDQKIGILAALFLAISPWHIFASRNAFESDILIFFISIATYFFLRGLENPKWLTVSFVTYALSFYIYRSSWLFIPLFVLSLFIFHKDQLNKIKKDLIKNAAIALVILLPLVPTVSTFRGQSRFFQESFIAGVQGSGIIDDVNDRRGSCNQKLKSEVCALVYNKYIFYVSTYLNNYISNLSFETYYVRANPTGYQSAPTRGFFYTFELPLLIAGLIFLLFSKNSAIKILIPWLLIVPIGPSITSVGNPGRLNVLMPVPQILAAVGLVVLLNLVKNVRVGVILIGLLVIILVYSTSRFIVDMVYYYPKISARYQRYGYKQLFDFLDSKRASYTQIAISRKTDDAKQYIHYLFNAKYDPKFYLESGQTVRYRGPGQWQVVEKIENVVFYPSVPKLDTLPPKTILAVGEKEVSFPAKPIFLVNDLKGDQLFEVYDVDEVKKKIEEIKRNE